MEVPIPDDWDGESFCRWAVCWPNSVKWKAILYGLIEAPTQGRFWDFDTGNFLNLRNQFREAKDYNFELKEVIMACGDTGIAEGLQAIAVSLRALATATATANSNASAIASVSGGDCCAGAIINQGGGVYGRIDQEGQPSIPIYGTEPPLAIAPGEFPEGFESREEYDLDKCQMSYLIIDGLISSLRALGAISGAETGAALAFLIISCITASIIFPPAAVGIVAAAFGVGTVIFTVLLQAVEYIQEHKAEWVCALYNGDSTEEIIVVISALISAMIAALVIPSVIGVALTTIILTLLSTDTLNQLFRLRAHLTYPDADCSSCACSESGDFTDVNHFDWEWTEGAGNATEINADGHWGGETFGGLSQWGGIVLNKEKPAGTVIDITYNFDCEAGVPLGNLGCYVEGFENGDWVIEDIQTPGDCFNNTVHCDLDDDATAIRVRFVVDGSTPVSWVVQSYSLACP